MSISVTCLHICVYVYICYISLPMCISMYLILNVLVWMYVVVCAKKLLIEVFLTLQTWSSKCPRDSHPVLGIKLYSINFSEAIII